MCEMPTKNDVFFSAASCKKATLFGGHLKQILALLILLRLDILLSLAHRIQEPILKLKTPEDSRNFLTIAPDETINNLVGGCTLKKIINQQT